MASPDNVAGAELSEVSLESTEPQSELQVQDNRNSGEIAVQITESGDSNPAGTTTSTSNETTTESTSPDNVNNAGPPSTVTQLDRYYKIRKEEFYCAKFGRLERALEDVRQSCYNPEEDGENILGIWLLLEVDHWDNETEKIVMLTDESLITARYDFVPMKVYKAKKVVIKEIDTIQKGAFQYPRFSLCNLSPDFKRRRCDGLRICWNRGVEPGFSESWSASSRAMPWQTFCHHPLRTVTEGEDAYRYDIEDLMEKVVHAVNSAYERHGLDRVLNVKNEPVYQKIYLGIISQLHNDSYLGMSKERGGFSF